MNKLSKILVPLVAVLAIASAVIGFLTGVRVKTYKLRADEMQKGILNTAGSLSEGSEAGTFLSAKDLEWETFKADKDASHKAFKDKVSSLDAYAKNIIAQRNLESETIARLTLTLGMKAADMPTEELSEIGNYKMVPSGEEEVFANTRLNLAVDYAKAYAARDRELLAGIGKVAGVLGVKSAGSLQALPKVAVTAATEETPMSYKVTPQSYGKPFDEMVAQIRAKDARIAAFQKALKEAPTALSNYREWKFRAADLNSGKYAEAIKALAADLANINNKLKLLASVQKELTAKRTELAASEKMAETLTQEKRALQQKTETLMKELKKLQGDGNAPVIRVPLKNASEVDRTKSGKILLVNYDWNFVIGNLGCYDVVVGLPVILTKDGKYLASGVVIEVQEEICMIQFTVAPTVPLPKSGLKFMISDVDQVKVED